MSIKKIITRIKYPLLAVLFAFALFSVTQAAMRPSDATNKQARRPNARWSSPHASPSILADNPAPPTQPVKLIFIHHSTGGNWLADSGEHDQAGGLGQALMDNNYFVSATNYGWGPGSIGSNTDVPSWPDWFTGPSSSAILSALYAESGQNICGEDMCFGNWSRPETDPGGENEIIMFKSCFPNSDVYGNPGAPPASEPNGDFTVSNFKAVYNDLLTYFETRQDKLFIVITAPPMAEVSYVINDNSTPAADRAANARAFNTWLMNDWLDGYAYDNVAVFDFYNVLTSNGSTSRIDDTSTREEPDDYDLRPDGNHHYWNGSEVVHPQTIANNFAAYPYFSEDPATPDPWSDDHPTAAGNHKATAEFVPLLNVFYNRWKSGAAPTLPALTLIQPDGGETWQVGTQQQIQWTTTGAITGVNLYYTTESFVTQHDVALDLVNTNSYNWTIPNDPSTSVLVRIESVVSPTTVYDVSAAVFTIDAPAQILPELTLTAPTTGVQWRTSSTQTIQWTTNGTVDNVNLYYSLDGVTTTLDTNVANTGSYLWNTPATTSTAALVRVESVVSPTEVFDVSGVFTLYQPSVMDKFIYLPLILYNYAPDPPACATPLTGVTISGPSSGSIILPGVHPSPRHSPPPHALAANAPTAQPSGLTSLYRSGQTFLTWNEDTGSSGESYHVYRHTAPINAGNLAQATRLTEKWGPLPEGSSIFYTDRDRDPSGNIIPGLQNYVITDLGAPLTDTVGLFVWTTKQAGDFYYAVTTVTSGVENRTDFGAGNSLASPVTEAVADPDPILVWESPSGNGRVYTQFMDFETYNPTFERPAAHPDGGLQYAYNYWVGLPTPEMCDGPVPSVLPVLLHIEGYGSRYAAEGGDSSTYFCVAEIWGDDPRQSWYYGFSATYDYRSGDPSADPATSGPIVNYAEERLLRAIYDTLRDPHYHIDLQRIYVYGHSMGGSGALALAMRYPNVFAASYSSEPMTNYQTSSVFNAECETKWGSISANLPISNVGRYAGSLAAYNGTGVWDWQNHQANLANRAGDDMAHISLGHGTLDDTIEWSNQGQPVYAAFYTGRRAFSGVTLEDGHSWIGFSGMGPNVTADLGTPFYNFNVVRNETIPGLTYASGSSVTPPPGADAAYNLNLEWSASWDDWDGAPLDTAGQWRISLRTTDSSNQTVDVTPRRVQTFVITPGATYTWENRRVSDDGLVDSGSVAAASNGLVTVEDVAVSPDGNRLSLHPGSGPVLPTLTLTSPNSGESWQVGSQHSIQWTSTGSIANVSLAYSTDGFATSHPIIASTTNTGSYNWTIPDDPTTTARVRVSSVVTPSIRDDSNANFTIQQAGSTTTYVFTATIAPANATPPVAYTWSPAPLNGQGTAVASYQWATPGAYIITATATNCGGTFAATHSIIIGGAQTQTVRLVPDTTNGIHVFNDQLANMSEEQFEFAATHYAGTQKMTRTAADHLRTYNPNFVILHYRLGMGLGYRGIESGCTPSGDWLAIIKGDDWVQEWPGDGNVVEDWFYHWPETGTTRVLNCDWGWYLMNLDNAAWRTYWSGELLRQLQANDDDGIFADSFSVPNYLGYDHYNPNLPEMDNTFESQWTTRLDNFMTYVQQGSLAAYHFIPNAGQWVTSRETTDYAIADGVMIEGFGNWGYGSYFDLADWQLQMDRILELVGQDKVILAQQYITTDDINERMFILGSYLLIKGRYTYLNFELDLDPEWFPEYGIPIGSPTDGTPANIAALWNAGWGVYARTYSNGRVLVNPTPTTQTVALGQTYYRATPSGGGFVPADGDVSAWTVNYAPVTSVELAPNQAAVLLNTAP